MNNLKNDEYYVRKMLNDLNFITEQMQGITIRTLGENQVLMDSMCFRLIQIQENAKKLSEEYKLSHNKIQWRDIAGLRNYIVHDYGNVDLSILFSTLTEDIPFLINELEKIEQQKDRPTTSLSPFYYSEEKLDLCDKAAVQGN